MEEREQMRNDEMEPNKGYFAFISYSSKDTKWGKRLQKKLENYRMPKKLCAEHGWERKPMHPVFFAPNDIQPGGLTEELKKRLRASKHLIVIGSPNSAKSEWVGKEIEYFHSLGREDKIHYFIVDGVPNSENPDTECFHPKLKELKMPEILGVNIHETNHRLPWLNKERAYVQLISKMMGVEFDDIWQRRKRLLINLAIAWAIGALAVLAVLGWVWMSNQPFDARLGLNEVSIINNQLPPLHDAVVTLTLDNETKMDTIHANAAALFANIPHRFLGQETHITFDAPDFQPLDTTVKLSRDVTLNINRNAEVYGNVHFTLWNPATEAGIPNCTVKIAGQQVTSDAKGEVRLTVPLEAQRQRYLIEAPFPLLGDTIYMPCGDNDVIQKK